jgi:hypothetical protein
MKNTLIALVTLLVGAASFALLPAQEPVRIYNKAKAGGAVVTASPYSAVAVTENVQTLADGNRIVQNHSEKLYRDGQGRERSETGDGVEAVISDPVTKTTTTLNSRTKTATQRPAGFFNLQLRNAPVQAAVEAQAALAAQLAALQAQREASIAAAGGRGGAPATAATPAPGGRGGGRGRGPAPAGGNQNTTTETLTPQNIEGVYATGTRTTLTIPAGQIGNEKAILVVDEVWFSPDLKINVLTKHSDPRMGENVYRLTNISRAEPDPTLFQVPAGYTMSGNPNWAVPNATK